MVSLWGSKNGAEDHPDDDGEATPTEGEESRQTPRHSGGRNPDERTRLLPPPRNEGFLSPDDPAVSTDLSLITFFILRSAGHSL